MLARIGDINFVAKEVAYYVICKTRYQTKQIRLKTKVMQTETFRAAID